MVAPWTLLYADDVMLACEDKTELERQAQAWCDRLVLFGLKLNVKKTEYLTTDVNEHELLRSVCNGNENATVDGRSYALDRVRNDIIRQRFGVVPISDKLHEARLRWYGHVLCANDDTVRKIGLNLGVLDKRPRGCPKQRWLDMLHLDLKIAGVHPDQAFDRKHWCHNAGRADPAAKRDRR
ncbi:unnamed protein product [Heligmosomoides polygyrus]|uniref:Reverse transcriptase domain-containing protein n=1 Tax=Heligmosomoides polygyrus TaxID=6339 RepID=A0A3P8A738_HELPZ|nr:unnamed protein product [Heligmosomoides polygyrus]